MWCVVRCVCVCGVMRCGVVCCEVCVCYEVWCGVL